MELLLHKETILPGFIESHAHVTFQNVRKDKVLVHGITTVQDTGGYSLNIFGEAMTKLAYL
jgi:adenine deaminase